MKKIYLLILVGLITCFAIPFLSSCKEEMPQPAPTIMLNEQDSLTMMEIYKSTGGGTDWAITWDLKNHKTWKNIVFEEINGEYRITSIAIEDLYPYSPNGILPDAIGNFSELKRLYINSKRIKGELPKSIGNLTKLKDLRITSTSINTGIPPEIGKLHNLEHLYLYYNQFSGTLPKELGELPINAKIIISYNENLSGAVPLELLDNQRENVSLDHSNFTELPWECWLSPNYGIPSMLYNRLSGEVPEEVLQSAKWEKYKNKVSPQQKGYGYTFKN